MKIEIEAGGLKQAPIWQNHSRSKNWMAKIAVDPTEPGGLRRDFARKARGDFTYLVASWMVPDTPIEFGADYYTGSGRKHADRWYGVIRAISETEIEFEKFETARDAIKAAKEPPPTTLNPETSTPNTETQ
jgi:hypothetical protein